MPTDQHNKCAQNGFANDQSRHTDVTIDGGDENLEAPMDVNPFSAFGHERVLIAIRKDTGVEDRFTGFEMPPDVIIGEIKQAANKHED